MRTHKIVLTKIAADLAPRCSRGLLFRNFRADAIASRGGRRLQQILEQDARKHATRGARKVEMLPLMLLASDANVVPRWATVALQCTTSAPQGNDCDNPRIMWSRQMFQVSNETRQWYSSSWLKMKSAVAGSAGRADLTWMLAPQL